MKADKDVVWLPLSLTCSIWHWHESGRFLSHMVFGIYKSRWKQCLLLERRRFRCGVLPCSRGLVSGDVQKTFTILIFLTGSSFLIDRSEVDGSESSILTDMYIMIIQCSSLKSLCLGAFSLRRDWSVRGKKLRVYPNGICGGYLRLVKMCWRTIHAMNRWIN